MGKAPVWKQFSVRLRPEQVQEIDSLADVLRLPGGRLVRRGAVVRGLLLVALADDRVLEPGYVEQVREAVVRGVAVPGCAGVAEAACEVLPCGSR